MTASFDELSRATVAAVEKAGQSLVRVDARRRHPASGIVWSADGVILTANHVVQRDDEIKVGLPDGSEVAATLAGRDPSTDLAVLRTQSQGLTAADWIGEDDLGVGALVLALGRPGQSVQASLGIISAMGGAWRTGSGGKVSHYVKPDLVMYPGFSGGPIVGIGGALVGLATSALTRDGGVAITAATVKPVVETLLAHGHMKRGYLGVGVQTVRLPDSVAKAAGQEIGVMLNSVESDSPAEKSGLVVGDILVSLDGEAVQRPDDLALLLQGDRAGSEVPVKVVRGGQLQDMTVTVGVRE